MSTWSSQKPWGVSGTDTLSVYSRDEAASQSAYDFVKVLKTGVDRIDPRIKYFMIHCFAQATMPPVCHAES